MGISSKIAWAFGGVCIMGSLCAEVNNDMSLGSPSPSFGKSQIIDVVKRLNAAEQKLNQVSEKKVSKSYGIKNPYALGCIGGHKGVFTQLSFLYWRAVTEGFCYTREILPYLAPNEISKNRYVKFHPSPGFRYAVGYTSDYDSWNFEGIYTWIRLEGDRKATSNSFTTTNDIGFIPNFPFVDESSDLGTYQSSEAKWRMSHHIGDLQFNRSFFITKALVLQPLLGARVAILSQKASDYFIGSKVANVIWAEKYVSHTSYWGIGPRIGADAKWTLPHNFGFTGLLSGSLLYGKVKDNTRWYEMAGAGESFEETGREQASHHSIVPNIQLALGTDWGMAFHKDRMYWGLNLSWELNYWWEPFPFDYSQQHSQPFETQGLTLRADLHF